MSLRRFRRFRPGAKLPADLSQVPETVELVVDPFYDGWRLDRFLGAHLPWRSRSQIQRAVRAGDVLKNGARSAPARIVRAGDRLAVSVPAPTEDLSQLDAIELPIVFEDEWFVAVDKPPNLLSHPVGARRFTSVINLLHARYRDPDPARDVVPVLAHRLDQETSGVLLITKDRAARRAMTRLFVRAEVDKEYLAIVEGHLPIEAGLIDLPIAPRLGHEITLTRVAGRAPEAAGPDAQSARTRFVVLEVVPGFTLVRCTLLSGRQHQIRVHFEALGHPLLGDAYYGCRRLLTAADAEAIRARAPRELEARSRPDAQPARTDERGSERCPSTSASSRSRPAVVPAQPDELVLARPAHTTWRRTMIADPVTGSSGATGQKPRPVGVTEAPGVLIDRVALHAARLAFTHPITGMRLAIEAPLPDDLARTLAALRPVASASMPGS